MDSKRLYLRWPEQIAITDRATSPMDTKTEKYGVQTIYLNSGDYRDISQKITEMQMDLKYKSRFEELQRHVSLMPGGSEYLAAKEDFEDNVNK